LAGNYQGVAKREAPQKDNNHKKKGGGGKKIRGRVICARRRKGTVGASSPEAMAIRIPRKKEGMECDGEKKGDLFQRGDTTGT